MLSEDLKKTIQKAYSDYLASRGLKARYGQKLMIAEVAKALASIETDDKKQRVNDSGVAAVEAGTGTGKTAAYVISSLPIAKEAGKSLVISTATITLQNQIIEKDLPELQEHSGLEFTFGLAKGRGRYLCLLKLHQAIDSQAGALSNLSMFEHDLTEDEKASKLYQEMLVEYGKSSWSGDRDDWPEEIQDQYWQFATATHRECTNRRCTHFNNCAFFKARQEIEDVDIIVANHDLVLADLALGGGAVLPLPSDAIFVFDEGHHLADKALSHFSTRTGVKGCFQWLEQWRKTQRSLEKELVQAESLRRVYEQNERHMDEAEARLKDVWQQVTQIASFAEPSPYQSEYPVYRFPDGIIPDYLLELSTALKIILSSLLSGFDRILNAMKDGLAGENDEITKDQAEVWYPVVGVYLSRCESHFALFQSYSYQERGGLPMARWLEQRVTNGEEDIILNASPILASRTLERELWNVAYGAIVTSATLTSANNFNRLKMQSGIPDWSQFLQVPSPFNYTELAEFCVPINALDASQIQQHTDYLINAIPKLIGDELGSLVLFSSRRQMNEVLEGLAENFKSRCLIQGQLSRSEIMKRHRQSIDEGEPSCLFGLASFAEGVDLPGDYLSRVIIAKLPFSTPDDPIDAALSEWIEKNGGNPFMQITLPDACLKLVQAAGRLIRTETDSGKVYLLDRRVVTKRYGQMLINSLPPFSKNLNA